MLRYQYSVDNEFGIRLRQARKAAGLTLQGCADLLNSKYGMTINKGSISKYENGVHEPSISLVHCLSETLDIDRDYLLGRNSNPDSLCNEDRFIQFRVEDDSMEPKYLREDLLMISRDCKIKKNMFCLAKMKDGSRLVRRLTKDQRGWVLEALNYQYEDIVIGHYLLSELKCPSDVIDVQTSDYEADPDTQKQNEDCRIIGVVVELRRSELFT